MVAEGLIDNGQHNTLLEHKHTKNVVQIVTGHIDELIFSDLFTYLAPLVNPARLGAPSPHFSSRSTSVTNQHIAALHDAGLAVLPCFIASTSPQLNEVLSDEIEITRQFWITARQEQRRLARVRLL